MVEREKCCGCGACFSICPQHCISMEEDKLGFLYPVIDSKKCVHCGLCEKVCPPLSKKKVEDPTCFEVYGGYAKDAQLRHASSSGGFFSLIATHVLEQGGVVFGAALEKNCESVTHTKISSIKELYVLRGSKYVQSKTYEMYSEVQKELKDGKLVLFSGTPCQIEGLNLFLQKPYENLISVEVICHGTPAPMLLKKYVHEISGKLKARIAHMSFRDELGGVL